MPRLMKAAVVHQFGRPLRIECVPVPVPGPGEILVKVVACGVCHTDLHAAEGDWPVKPTPPFIPGHEVAGIVAELGAGVTGFKEGDAVGVAWLGFMMLACGANIARLAGKLCASNSTIPGIAAMAGSPNMSLRRPPLRPGCRKISISRLFRRSFAQALPLTRVSRRRKPDRASGWRSPASGAWPCRDTICQGDGLACRRA